VCHLWGMATREVSPSCVKPYGSAHDLIPHTASPVTQGSSIPTPHSVRRGAVVRRGMCWAADHCDRSDGSGYKAGALSVSESCRRGHADRRRAQRGVGWMTALSRGRNARGLGSRGDRYGLKQGKAKAKTQPRHEYNQTPNQKPRNKRRRKKPSIR
jgi:hypothetical protein